MNLNRMFMMNLNRIIKEGTNPQAPAGLHEKIQAQKAEHKAEISLLRINKALPGIRDLVSYYREYPDLFLDSVADPKEKFSFFFYQRIFLRAAMRHRYVYATFPRAYSKSFLSILVLYVRCILYPNSKVFIASGGKEQSAKIATDKIEEIWRFFPALKNELVFGTGSGTTKMAKDYIKLVFKNGSYLDVVAARESSRGGRRTSGLIEEAATVPGEILSSVVLPRRTLWGF